jgi:Leucine-rich repeat (LRR) protein
MTDPNYKIAEIGRTGIRQFILKGEWHSSMADVMRRENISAMMVSGYAGWNGANLDFLREIPFLERLSLIVLNPVNIDGIYFLRHLKDFSIGYNKKRIDFVQFPSLERVSLSWSIGYESLFECKSLKDVAIARLPEDRLPSLSHLANVESLALSLGRFSDLQTLPELPRLVRLSLIVCNRLQHLKGLESSPNLRVLWIEQAKSLIDIDAVAFLQTLRTLVLRDCRQVKSIKALAGLPDLESVSFSATTDIRDGDLSPLESLPRLKNADFKDRRHYSKKNIDFPKDLPIFL